MISEGVKYIRPQDDMVDLVATLPNWIGWHQAEITGDNVLIPAQLINGQRVVIEMSASYIKEECEAPSVEEYLAKKVEDYPPSEDNTYWWANGK